MKLPKHRTKIVCTVGPASRTLAGIEALIKGGMNVARLNFSHSAPDIHKENILNIRRISHKLNKPVSILIDLPGVKIRIGKLKDNEVFLRKASTLTLTTRPVLGTASLISINYRALPQSIAKGSVIYLNDGFIQLKVQRVSASEIKCRVLTDGKLLSYKGLNIPGAKLSVDPVTPKDLEAVRFGLGLGVTTFGISFVEKAADIAKVRHFARKLGKSVYLVAKIERREAIRNFSEILEEADAVMIARGDLGIEIPMEEVPVRQKELIFQANVRGRAVITATQMLGSMTQNIRPTRAEVNDVANAVIDGTDALMLSEETAIGQYPNEAVKTMVKIATATEYARRRAALSDRIRGQLSHDLHGDMRIPQVISLNTVRAVEKLSAKYVLTQTTSGSTARHISRFKPECWILAFSEHKAVCDFLNFSYGVYPILMRDQLRRKPQYLLSYIKKRAWARPGDIVVITQRRFSGDSGHTDSLSAAYIP